MCGHDRGGAAAGGGPDRRSSGGPRERLFMKRKPKFDPALPLRNVRHEAFARARVVLETPLRAMQLAGYEKPTAGNAARLDRHPNIIARVRHLSACDNDLAMVTLRRNRLRN